MDGPIGTAIFVVCLFWVISAWPLYACPSKTDPWAADPVCMAKVDKFIHGEKGKKP